MTEKREIEINGIKFEVETRKMRKIESYKVGDPVKILIKKYNDEWETYTGIIVDFIAFQNLPTIVIAYIELGYNSNDIHFIDVNEKNENVEIAPLPKHETRIRKADFLLKLNKSIEEKKEKIKALEYIKDIFLDHLDKYYKDIEEDKCKE